MSQPLTPLVRLRRAQAVLMPYVENMDIVGNDNLYIRGTVAINGVKHPLTIKVDRMLARICKLILRLEPAVAGGRVKLDDLKYLLLGIYGSLRDVYRNREHVRRVTGLVAKDEKVKNHIIYRRVKASEKFSKRETSYRLA